MQIVTKGPERRYAKALFALLQDAKASTKIFTQIEALVSALTASKDVGAYLANPVVSHADKEHLLVSLAGEAKADDVLTHFIQVVAQNGRANMLATIFKLVIAMKQEQEGTVVAYVKSASALEKAQREALTGFVKAQDKSVKDVLLHEEIDTSLIAGVTLTVGSKQFDTSLRGALESFASTLRS